MANPNWVAGSMAPRLDQQKGAANSARALELAKRFPGFQPLKNLSKKELVDVGNILLKGDMIGLAELAEDPTAPPLLATFANILCTIHRRGDMQGFDMLLNRLIGKVREEVHHGGSIGGTHGSTVIVTLPTNGREAPKPVQQVKQQVIDVQAEPVVPVDDFDFGG